MANEEKYKVKKLSTEELKAVSGGWYTGEPEYAYPCPRPGCGGAVYKRCLQAATAIRVFQCEKFPGSCDYVKTEEII